MATVRVACVQADVVFKNATANAARAVECLNRLKGQGVDLAVFPEAYLTGYCFDSAEDARDAAISPLDHGLISDLSRAAEELDIMAVIGFVEWVAGARESEGSRLHNSALLLEPGLPPRIYRKNHLPDLGVDKFVEQGSGLAVFDTRIGKLGVLICFDLRLPEAMRVLALQGAELVVLPTNWPEGAEVSAEHICIARAAENRVFVATCNRVGEENGFRFIGRSKIIGPGGQVLASAGGGQETIMADLDLAQARQKRTVVIPGKYETDAFASRRPELYGPIIDR